MTVAGVLIFCAEILVGPHIHIPDALIAVNSNLLYLPMFEILSVYAVIGWVLWRR